MNSIKSAARVWINIFASPMVIMFALPWLMILLAAGTLAQKYLGLYLTENMFFANFIFWLHGVPLPGMLSVLTLIAFSLTIKLFFRSPWVPARAGILITHLGALLLLLGGLVTALTAQEGNMVLAPGQVAATFADYHARELVIYQNDKVVLTLPFSDLSAGQKIENSALPFAPQIQKLCKNCQLARSGANIHLADAPLKKQDEDNIAGVEFKIAGQNFIAAEDQAAPPEYQNYHFTLQKTSYPLPFSVQLLDMDEQTYPGTDVASGYQSRLRVRDGALHFDTTIQMNAPLRYRGYTFYQAEFDQVGDQNYSVLAVVKNTGRSFPYIASFVLCSGILLHLIIRWRRP